MTNFEIQSYYQNKLRFNGVYSRNKLPKIKDGVCVINLDGCESVWAHWIALSVNSNNVKYFEVEYIPKNTKKIIGNESIITSIYSIQVNVIVLICGCVDICILDLLILCLKVKAY